MEQIVVSDGADILALDRERKGHVFRQLGGGFVSRGSYAH